MAKLDLDKLLIQARGVTEEDDPEITGYRLLAWTTRSPPVSTAASAT